MKHSDTKEYERLKRVAAAANSIEDGSMLISLEPDEVEFLYDMLCEFMGTHWDKRENVLRQSKEWLDADSVSRRLVSKFIYGRCEDE